MSICGEWDEWNVGFDDKADEEVVDVFVEVDTRSLSAEDEGNLAELLEDTVIRCHGIYTRLQVELVNVPKPDDTGDDYEERPYGKIEIWGEAYSRELEDILDVLAEADVPYSW